MSQGPTGPQGERGLQGPQGPAGPSGSGVATNIFSGVLTQIPTIVNSNEPIPLTVALSDDNNFNGISFTAPRSGVYFIQADVSVLPLIFGSEIRTYIRLEFFINRGIPGGFEFGGSDIYYDPVVAVNPLKINTCAYIPLQTGETVTLNLSNFENVPMRVYRATFIGSRIGEIPPFG